jgi:hypothetical protein
MAADGLSSPQLGHENKKAAFAANRADAMPSRPLKEAGLSGDLLLSSLVPEPEGSSFQNTFIGTILAGVTAAWILICVRGQNAVEFTTASVFASDVVFALLVLAIILLKMHRANSEVARGLVS